MLTHFEVRTVQGNLLTVQLEEDDSGIVVEDVKGLTPVKATIVSSSFAAKDGTQYQSSRREDRNITMRFALEPDYISTTVRDLRTRLYNFFMPKSLVYLRFFTSDGLTVDISGRVETCEPVLFTREPKIDISIVCFDPDFLEITPTVLTGNTVSTSTDTLVEYNGTVETGFVFKLTLNRSLSQFTIYNRLPDNTTQTLDFVASLLSGDILTITTISGSKSIILTRSGVNSSLLYGMTPESSFIELFPGDNNLRVYATGAAIPYEITYVTRHGGL